MSNVFTTDSLREETKKKFAPFVLGLSDGTETTLVSALRLSSEDRKTVKAALEDITSFSEEDDSPEAIDRLIEIISKVFYVVADKPTKLLADLHDEDTRVKVALMSRVISEWAKETRLGKPEPRHPGRQARRGSDPRSEALLRD